MEQQQSRLQNSPRENDYSYHKHRQSQKLLFTNQASFIQIGHKGEEPEICLDENDSVNLTENPLNTTDHSDIFKKPFQRGTNHRIPQRISLQERGSLDLKKDNSQQNALSNILLKQQPSNETQNGTDSYPTQIQDRLALYSYNGCNMMNLQSDKSAQVSNFLENNKPNRCSPTTSINNVVIENLKDDKNSKYYQNRQSIVKLMKAPSITDFTNPKAKKRFTQIIKSTIMESNQLKQIENFEKGNKIILKVLKNSMDRMQRIEMHLKGFVNKILHNSSVRNATHLKAEAYQLVKDKAFIYKQRQKTHSRWILLFNQLLKKTKKCQLIKVFMPTSSYRLFWDAIQVLFTVIFLFMFSILIFFCQEVQSSSDILQIYFQVTFYLFIGDMVISFNTAFFNKDNIVLDRQLIAQKYLKSQFTTDAICLIILSLKIIFNEDNIGYNPDHNMMTYFKNILVFSKIFGIKQKSQMLQSVSALKDSQKHLLRLLTNIFLVVLAAHIVCILWYQLSLIESYYNFTVTWITKYGIQNVEWYSMYIYSLYWSVTTMTTVGYGDISASNDVEALFVSIMMIFMSCVFAYSINNIGLILQAIERDAQDLNDNVTTIQRYLNRKNVNVELKSRIRHYLYFLAEEQKDRNKEVEDKVISKLSNKLREEVMNEVNSRILKKYMIFTKQFSNETINRIVTIMKEVLISPNEIIFKENQADDNALYLIENGVVEIQYSKPGSESHPVVVNTLTQNQLFGEISLFSGLSRTATARSVNLSTLYKITRQDLIDVLKQNNEDFQRFKMINEQIVFYNDYSALGLECYTCKKQGHVSSMCSLTHLNSDRQFIALKYSFSLFQQRGENTRQRSKIKKRFIVIQKKQYQKLKQKLFSDESDDEYDDNISFETKYKLENDYDEDEDDDENSRFTDMTAFAKLEDYAILDQSISKQEDQMREFQKQETKAKRNVTQEDIEKNYDKPSCIQREIENSIGVRQSSKRQISFLQSKEELNENLEKKIMRKNQKLKTKLDSMDQISYLDNNTSILIPESHSIIRPNNKKKLSYQVDKDTVSIEKQLLDQVKENKESESEFSSSKIVYADRDNESNSLVMSTGDFSVDRKSDQKRKLAKKSTFNNPIHKMTSFQDYAGNEKEEQKNQNGSPKLKPLSVIYNGEYQLNQVSPDKMNQYNNPDNNNIIRFQDNRINPQTYANFNEKQENILDYFDCQREYSKFFPHNNLSKILEKIRSQQTHSRKSKLKGSPSKIGNRISHELKQFRPIRRFNIVLTEEIRQNLFLQNNPTSVAYGIGQKGQHPQYPLRKN